MKTSLVLLSVMALSACAGIDDDLRRSYFSEAGSLVDGGDFGGATMNNTQVMTGERGHVLDLSNRFAREVGTTVNFAFNSTTLSPEARATLRAQAAWIRQFPEVRFRVYGHTDAVGSNVYNKRLGLRRARAAVAYLTTQGIGRNRLEAVASFGETQPLIVTQGRERRNRRTVTEVSGFVASHPIIMEGKYAEVVHRETIASAKPKSTLTNAGQIASGPVGGE